MEARDHVTRLQGRLLSRDQSRLDDGLMSFSIIVLGFGPGLSLLCSSLRLVLWVSFVAAVFLTSDDALLRAAQKEAANPGLHYIGTCHNWLHIAYSNCSDFARCLTTSFLRTSAVSSVTCLTRTVRWQRSSAMSTDVAE